MPTQNKRFENSEKFGTETQTNKSHQPLHYDMARDILKKYGNGINPVGTLFHVTLEDKFSMFNIRNLESKAITC